MMNLYFSGGLLLLVILMTSTKIMAQDDALRAVAKANTNFTSNLYFALRKSMPGNLIFSPYSVSAVIAMIKAGARGQTATDIQTAFSFPSDDKQLNEGYQALIASLKGDKANFTLETANKIYTQQGFKIQQSYIDTVQKYYGADVKQLDFSKGEASAKEINHFVSSATHDKIKDLISAGDLDSMTRLVLVNAIYFKGLWKNKFNPSLTKEGIFHLNNKDKVKVQMMRVEAEFPFAEIDELDAKAIALPYQGDRLSMIILLPNDIEGLPDMEEKLKTFTLASVPARLKERKVTVMMPKFTLESTIDLQEPLTALGAGSMFDQNAADFSGIPEDKQQLFVSKAVQKAFIEVNEEGSEAAAATGVQITLKSAFMGHRFLADRPFYAMIVDDDTSAVLFSTGLSNPTVSSIVLRRTQNNGGSVPLLLPSLIIMPLAAIFTNHRGFLLF